MALLTLTEVEGIAQRGRPWSFRLEYTGANPTNKGGVSDKFWYATGRAANEPVEVGWGANGKTPTTQLITWAEMKSRVADKLSKGYIYVSAPYVRMSAVNIAKILGVVPMTPPHAPVPPPVRPATPPSQPHIIPPKWVMGAAQAALGAPWNLIHLLEVVRDGIIIKGFKGLDAQGVEVLMFDEDGGQEFAQEHNLDILWR